MTDAGSYWTVTGTGNCTTQANANIMLSPDETPTISVEGETTICPLDQVVLTASPAASYLWSNGSDQQSIVVSAAGEYAVTIQGTCAEFTSSTVEVNVLNAPAAPVSNDVTIPVAGTADLTATGDSIFWYDVATGGTPIGQGNSWTTPFVDTNTLFWCADLGQNGGDTYHGGMTDRSAIGTYQNNSTYYLRFSTNEDMVIKSAKVYANGAGIRPIAIVDQNTGNVVASGDYYIPDGESRVQLDLLAPGNALTDCALYPYPQLWRDGVGSNPSFPYDLEVSVPSPEAMPALLITTTTSMTGRWPHPPRGAKGHGRWKCSSAPPRSTNEQADGLQVFPNPATESVTLSGELPEGATVVEFLDVAGRVCLRTSITTGGLTIDVAPLASGAYTVHVRGDHATSNTSFVKR